MERIEFFGSALLIPMFLVSIGTVIDPAVLVDPGTLGLAAVFVVACVGGKLIAAAALQAAVRLHHRRGRRRLRPVGSPGGGHAGGDVRRPADRAVHDVDRQRRDDRDRRQPDPRVRVSDPLRRADAEAGRWTRRASGASLLAHIGGTDEIGVRAHRRRHDRRRRRRDRATDVRRGRRRGPAQRRARRARRAGDHPPRPRRRARGAPRPLGTDGLLHDGRHARGVADRRARRCRSRGCRRCSAPASTRLVAASPVPVALVRSGARIGRRGSCWRCRRRRPSARAAPACSRRWSPCASRSTGSELVVVAADDPREDLVAILTGSATVVRRQPADWLEREGRSTDLVVLPGGRNGALSTARLTRQAVRIGATVAVAADRESVTTSELAAEGLGVVTRRGAAAAP